MARALSEARCTRRNNVRMPRCSNQASNGPSTAPALRRQDRIRSQNGSRRAVRTAPASTSLWPFRYLVAECTTRSAPCSNGRVSTGVATVVSTATRTPAACASAQTAALRVAPVQLPLTVRGRADPGGQAARYRVCLPQGLRGQRLPCHRSLLHQPLSPLRYRAVVISRDDIRRCYDTIRPYIRRTPVIQVGLGELDESAAALPAGTLKLEQLQCAGAFKARGAFTNLLLRERPPAGVA